MTKDKIFKLATLILILPSSDDDDNSVGTVKPEKPNTHNMSYQY